MKKINITTKTIEKVKSIFKVEQRPISRSYIASDYGINYQRVKVAVEYLMQHNDIIRVETSGVTLYQIKDNKEVRT